MIFGGGRLAAFVLISDDNEQVPGCPINEDLSNPLKDEKFAEVFTGNWEFDNELVAHAPMFDEP